MIDFPRFWWVATNNGQIFFVHGASFKLFTKRACHLCVEREKQNARCATIKAVRSPDPLSNLVAQDLNRKAGFVTVNF